MGRRKKTTATLMLLILAIPHRLSLNQKNRLILWNVGQGQWLTYSTSTFCHHLDMGGEKIQWWRVRRECGQKVNTVQFSHWDWDHLSFLKNAQGTLPQICLSRPPQGPKPTSLTKLSWMNSLAPCRPQPHSLPWREIQWDILPSKKIQPNDFSRVMIAQSRVLVPGDSPSKQERQWLNEIGSNHLRQIRLLILGHHGSKTSTSDSLLQGLPTLRQAWVSARRRRYGHPHQKVVKKLKTKGVPLLTTEAWGNLILID
ncbi:MAG: hydrolase [Bdellovibrionales bacterium]|nr:hydrolase [Bdellovibrionales bacterium]